MKYISNRSTYKRPFFTPIDKKHVKVFKLFSKDKSPEDLQRKMIVYNEPNKIYRPSVALEEKTELK